MQGARAKLMGVATSAEDAALMLEALEAGTHGIILRTDSAAEVRPRAHDHILYCYIAIWVTQLACWRSRLIAPCCAVAWGLHSLLGWQSSTSLKCRAVS